MRHKAIPAAAEDLGAKGLINRFSIGRRLALCFVGIFLLLLPVNGILLWQFHSAQARADRRLSGVSLELITALNLQSSLQSFNDKLDRAAQSQDAVLLRQESGSLRGMILDSVQDARNAGDARSDQRPGTGRCFNGIRPVDRPARDAAEMGARLFPIAPHARRAGRAVANSAHVS